MATKRPTKTTDSVDGSNNKIYACIDVNIPAALQPGWQTHTSRTHSKAVVTWEGRVTGTERSGDYLLGSWKPKRKRRNWAEERTTRGRRGGRTCASGGKGFGVTAQSPIAYIESPQPSARKYSSKEAAVPTTMVEVVIKAVVGMAMAAMAMVIRMATTVVRAELWWG